MTPIKASWSTFIVTPNKSMAEYLLLFITVLDHPRFKAEDNDNARSCDGDVLATSFWSNTQSIMIAPEIRRSKSCLDWEALTSGTVLLLHTLTSYQSLTGLHFHAAIAAYVIINSWLNRGSHLSLAERRTSHILIHTSCPPWNDPSMLLAAIERAKLEHDINFSRTTTGFWSRAARLPFWLLFKAQLPIESMPLENWRDFAILGGYAGQPSTVLSATDQSVL